MRLSVYWNAGGYLGAHVAINKGNKWVKVFFGIVVVISAIKVLVG
jgi:uncharacterized membrane protein YfcA